MEKEFVSYELSLALKEIGYQSPKPIGGYRGGAVFYYDKGSELFYDGLPMYSSSYHDGQIIAPLYQQVFRWFREEHDLHLLPSKNVNKWWATFGSWTSEVYDSYEEAQLECLKKLIQIVGEKVAR